MLNKIIHKILWSFTQLFPDRVRDISVDGSLYLRRFYLSPRRRDEYGELTDRFQGFGVYLHYFYRGDEDRELHNHPWKSAVSFILAGGYSEERRDNDTNEIVVHDIKPFRFNKIGNNDFHRVITKNNQYIWTLFFTGRRVDSWGFWNRETDKFIPFDRFLNDKPKAVSVSTKKFAN